MLIRVVGGQAGPGARGYAWGTYAPLVRCVPPTGRVTGSQLLGFPRARNAGTARSVVAGFGTAAPHFVQDAQMAAELEQRRGSGGVIARVVGGGIATLRERVT
jgi:hypothetical protein